jgi:hypothetical protein
MVTTEEIRNELARHLQGEITLCKFDDWLTRRSWNMHLDSPRDAQSLVGSLEWIMAEHHARHLSNAALKGEFLALAHGEI